MGTLTGSRMVDNQTSTSICEISPTRSKSRAGKKVKRWNLTEEDLLPLETRASSYPRGHTAPWLCKQGCGSHGPCPLSQAAGRRGWAGRKKTLPKSQVWDHLSWPCVLGLMLQVICAALGPFDVIASVNPFWFLSSCSPMVGGFLYCLEKHMWVCDFLFSMVFDIYLFIWLHWLLVAACGIFSCSMWTLRCGLWDLVPQPGIKLRTPALGTWSLSHWTTSEVPVFAF